MTGRDSQSQAGLFLDLLRRVDERGRGGAPDQAEVQRLAHALSQPPDGDGDFFDVLMDDETEADDELPSWLMEEGLAAIDAVFAPERGQVVERRLGMIEPAPATATSRIVVLDRDDMRATEKVVTVPQFADDQAVPRDLYDAMIARGAARTDPFAQELLAPWMAREFRRSLINSEAVVINRAFFINNASLFRLFTQRDENREGMIALLESHAIVPYLLREQSPLETPPGLLLNPEGVDGWLSVAGEASTIAALRLAMPDEENARLVKNLMTNRFQAVAQSLSARDLGKLADDLNLRPALGQTVRPLLDVLHLAERIASELGYRRAGDDGSPGFMSRTDFYLAFVSSAPQRGLYDGGALLQDPKRILTGSDLEEWIPRFIDLQRALSEPVRRACSRGLKEIIDLVYNTTLPDAIGGFALTPQDALPRTALQELAMAVQQAGPDERIGAKEIAEMVRRDAFSRIMADLAVPDIAALSLAQIERIRQTDEWSRYAHSLRGLLRTPANFTVEAASVRTAYTEMLRAVGHGAGAAPSGKFAPASKLLIHIAGATIEVVWSDGRVIWEERGRVSDLAPINHAPLSLQFAIGDQRGQDETGWTTVTEFHRGGIADPRRALQAIVDEFERRPGFQRANLVETTRQTTINNVV